MPASFSASNEKSSILVTHFLGNKSWEVSKKSFCSLSKNSTRKEEKKKNNGNCKALASRKSKKEKQMHSQTQKGKTNAFSLNKQSLK